MEATEEKRAKQPNADKYATANEIRICKKHFSEPPDSFVLLLGSERSMNECPICRGDTLEKVDSPQRTIPPNVAMFLDSQGKILCRRVVWV